MAFEPRIVRPDDLTRPKEMAAEIRASGTSERLEAEDNWLPDELQELAAQLSADAAHLADRFPIAAVQPELGRATVLRLLPRIAVAAAIFASAGLWVAWRGQRPDARSDGLVASTAESPTAKPADQLLIQAVITPAVLLDNLTGPEREGVLDLLEQQALEPSSVSI